MLFRSTFTTNGVIAAMADAAARVKAVLPPGTIPAAAPAGKTAEAATGASSYDEPAPAAKEKTPAAESKTTETTTSASPHE